MNVKHWAMLSLLLPAAGCLGQIGQLGTEQTGHGDVDVAALSSYMTASPLRRLTRAEYNNTLRDLLGDTSHPADGFVPDEFIGGFAANAIATASQLQIENYVAAAESIAEWVVSERLNQLISCDINDNSCVDEFISSFGRRAFRRPLDSEEQAVFSALYQQTTSTWSASLGIQLLIQAMLASPQLLYHLETGKPDQAESGIVPLTDYELASRLSYFLWHSMPDDALLDVAEQGLLSEETTIEEQARRMLADPKAADAIEVFHAQWLGVDDLGSLHKDEVLFPNWSETLAADMRQETTRFVTYVVLEDDGRMETLLTAPYSFINGSLASIYDINTTGSDFAKTPLNTAERQGVLTHPSILAATAHAAETSWVQRGKFIRDKFLCQTIPEPPPDVDQTTNNSADRVSNPECAGCHKMMDPIGRGFENYDAIGKMQTTDADGNAIDAKGEIIDLANSLDVNGQFSNLIDLATKLASSSSVAACFVSQWLQYAYRREVNSGDEAMSTALVKAFAEQQHHIPELLIAIVKHPAFRYLKQE